MRKPVLVVSGVRALALGRARCATKKFVSTESAK